MPSLAEPIQFDEPPSTYLSSTPGSALVKRLVWHGHSADTRKGYGTAIDSYEAFCATTGRTSWPATTESLEEWLAGRLYGGGTPKQGKIKPETAASYLAGLRSYHVDRGYGLTPFEGPRLQLMLKGGKRIFSQTKRRRLPISKELLTKITSIPAHSAEDLNIDATFKVAWAGFLRLGEITYTVADRKKTSFQRLKPTRGDISFAENDQYATLRLKRSKTDTNHSGVQIVLAATNESTCPVTALRRLFRNDPQPSTSPLFRLGTAFTRASVIASLKKRLIAAGINDSAYSGHSFRKGAAQHATDHGMLDESIQRLGRWSSNAFQLYFQTSQASLFNLNLSFQKGIPLAVPRAVVAETHPTNSYPYSIGHSIGRTGQPGHRSGAPPGTSI